MRSRDRKKVELRTGTSKDPRLDKSAQRTNLRATNPLKKNSEQKKASLSPAKITSGTSRLDLNLFGHRDSFGNGEDNKRNSPEKNREFRKIGNNQETRKESLKRKDATRKSDGLMNSIKEPKETVNQKLKRSMKIEKVEVNQPKKKPSEQEDENDLARYVETQQKRMLVDSCKHAEKIFDQHTKRMKLLNVQKPGLRNLVKKGAESLAVICAPNLKPELNTDTANENQKIIYEKSKSDRSHKSACYLTEEPKLAPGPFTKRNIGSFLQTETPKHRTDIVSERAKKNKRSTPIVETLKSPHLKTGQAQTPVNQSGLEEVGLARPQTPTMKEKPEKDLFTKDYQINDRYKIMNFLNNDKALQSGKEEIKEKLRKFKLDFRQQREDEPEPVEEVFSHLEIKDVIGIGAYAVVRLGFDTTRKETVAIKFYDKIKLMDLVKQKNYEAEVENLKELDHPNIIKLVDVIEGNKKVAMVMEYIGSYSLFDYLASCQKSKMQEPEAKTIFFQILQALEYSHKSSIIHRDIKLQNLIVNDKFQVKVIDFGFSIKVGEGKSLSVFCGTPSYMSPEIVKR